MGTIRIEIDVEVTAWADERLQSEAGFSEAEMEFINGYDDDEEGIPAAEIADCLVSHLNIGEYTQEALAGSSLFYDIGEVTLVRSAVSGA